MKVTRVIATVLITLMATCLPIRAQEATLQQPSLLANNSGAKRAKNPSFSPAAKRRIHRRPLITHPVIPPVTVLNNPEYLSGEASVSVTANSNPLIRIGIAQNGVTLIEFPATDKFFAVHAGNSDLVTVEKSPTLKRDHHLVLRAGSGFLLPASTAKGSQAIIPATSIIAQMDSGMAITVMIYPVPLLKQQAHRVVISYNRDDVVAARIAAGLAINLVGPEASSKAEVAASEPAQAPIPVDAAASSSKRADFPGLETLSKTALQESDTPVRANDEYKEPVEAALNEATRNPDWFKKWGERRHGLMISTLTPRDLSDSARLVLFAVRNAGPEPLRLIAGYPDLYIETLNEKHRPVEAGTRVEKFYLASSRNNNLLQPGAICYFGIAYEAPILGAQQHLKIVVAHTSAADEPAMIDLTAVAK